MGNYPSDKSKLDLPLRTLVAPNVVEVFPVLLQDGDNEIP